MPPLALDGDPRLRKEIASLGGANSSETASGKPEAVHWHEHNDA